MTWRKKQAQDVFYTKAKDEGYRSRAAYKLLEIQQKFAIIRPNSTVLDLGCAPGGWLQVARKYTQGMLVGIDLQSIEPLLKVHFGQFDFTDQDKLQAFLSEISAPQQFSVILSDMSPAISGDRDSDHFQSVDLVRCAVEFSHERLQNGGYLVCKLFDGPDTQQLMAEMKKNMSVKIYKPASSRSESREIYLVAQKL